MSKDKKDIRPLLVQLGVALAVSLAGFLFSRLKTRSAKNSRPPHLQRSSGPSNETDEGGGCRAGHSDDLHAMKKTPSGCSIASVPVGTKDDTCMVEDAVDSSTTGFSPNSKQAKSKDGYLLPEFNDLIKEFDLTVTPREVSPEKDVNMLRSVEENPRALGVTEKDDYEQEIRHLKNKVRVLQERERDLEAQLLEFYGLKEQESALKELRNLLKLKNMESKVLTLKIESLKAENQRLQAQAVDHANIVTELDAARAKIKQLKEKLRTEAVQNKEQVLALKRRVSRLQEQELKELKDSTTDPEIQLNLQRLKDLEVEVEELSKSNLTLHLENSELADQLESAQNLANSVIEDAETQSLRELTDGLRQENQELAKQVEQLQEDRCIDCEELVYLRWINACLRYELRNFQPLEGKTIARDLSKSLSPKSEEKAKELILEYASTEDKEGKAIEFMDFELDPWSSSQAYNFADLRNFDESSQSSKANSSTKMKIFKKLRRLLWGKDIHHDQHGLSEDKSGEIDDPGSPHGGFCTSTATSDLHSSRGQTPSVDSSIFSSRHSMDFQRSRSTKMDDLKDVERIRISSDVGSSYTRRRFSSCGGGAGDLSFQDQLDRDLYSKEKSELGKFAGALKGSGHTGRNLHRKVQSYGSIETFRRSSSQ